RQTSHAAKPALWFLCESLSKPPKTSSAQTLATQVAAATAPAYVLRSEFRQCVGSLHSKLAYACIFVAAVAAMARAASRAIGSTANGDTRARFALSCSARALGA
ncbi:MAG: hypothetical protein Q9187_003902, partial [Circinaria calcarea]